MSGSHKKLTFSDYFSFFRTRNGDELTYDQLVQVLSIHGFVKSRAHKHEVMDALASFDLMDPTRSMTHNGGSPLLGCGQVAAPSLKQTGRDIHEIGWEECPIGSIETIQPAQLAAEAHSGHSREVKLRERREGKEVKNHRLVSNEFYGHA